MKVENPYGNTPTGWSPKAVKFAASLGDLCNGDKETAEIVVLVAMNLIGGIAHRQDCSPEEVISRVIDNAYRQVEMLREDEAKAQAKQKERMN